MTRTQAYRIMESADFMGACLMLTTGTMTLIVVAWSALAVF